MQSPCLQQEVVRVGSTPKHKTTAHQKRSINANIFDESGDEQELSVVQLQQDKCRQPASPDAMVNLHFLSCSATVY